MPPLLELLDREDRWTQGAHATDARGKLVRIDDPDACRWCLSGGLMLCYPDDASYYTAELALAAAFHRLHPTCGRRFVTWQDTPGRTFAEVRQLLEAAGV